LDKKKAGKFLALIISDPFLRSVRKQSTKSKWKRPPVRQGADCWGIFGTVKGRPFRWWALRLGRRREGSKSVPD